MKLGSAVLETRVLKSSLAKNDELIKNRFSEDKQNLRHRVKNGPIRF